MSGHVQYCLNCQGALDISSLQPGTRFKCGLCGNVNLVSGGAPVAAPVQPTAPRSPAPPPAQPSVRRQPGPPPRSSARLTRAPAGVPRGPGRASMDRGRAPHGRGRSQNTPLLVGVALLVVAVAVGVLVMNSDKGAQILPETKKPKELPPAPTEAQLLRKRIDAMTNDYDTQGPTTKTGFQRYIRFLKESGDPGRLLLKRVYADYVDGPGGDDEEARVAIGHKSFTHEIPEQVVYRGYPFLRDVERAYAKRWYSTFEEASYRKAMQAWAETKAHVKRLETDRGYRAQNGVRANIASMPLLGSYNYVAKWSAPYLICYSGNDFSLNQEAQQEQDPGVRKRKEELLAKRREQYAQVLDEKLLVFKQVYAEYILRYKKAQNLGDLTAAYGGRPKGGASGTQLFADGVPLVVWIFSDQRAFQKHHERMGYGKLDDSIAGYFSPRTGWVFLFDDPKDRQFEINKNVHEAVHQLQYWFTRQRNDWRRPAFGQDFLGEGVAEVLGAVKMDINRNLVFQEVNPTRVRGIQAVTRLLRKKKRSYPLFPVEELVGFGTYRDATSYAVKKWNVSPDLAMALFYQQSWAFTYFLMKYRDGMYQPSLNRFLKHALDNKTSYFLRLKSFKDAFRIRDKMDFALIDKAYASFFQYDIRTLDVSDWTYRPPGRFDWPKK